MNFDLLYMILILGGFYGVAAFTHTTTDDLWAEDWLLPPVSGVEWYTVYEHAFDYTNIKWDVVEANLANVAAISFFSVLMGITGLAGTAEVPGAVPKGESFNINRELKVPDFTALLNVLFGCVGASTTMPDVLSE